MCFEFIFPDSWTGARRENQESIRCASRIRIALTGFVSSAREQLALVSDYGFHWIPFGSGHQLADGVGIAPTQPRGLTRFSDRGITALPTMIGAAGRIPTCIVPFRRRMPHVFDHGSTVKLVSAAGLAPAIHHSRSQAEGVGCYTTRWSPDALASGLRDSGEHGAAEPWNGAPREILKIGGPEGTCTLNPPADNGALF
jgi:hypothetical protein